MAASPAARLSPRESARRPGRARRLRRGRRPHGDRDRADVDVRLLRTVRPGCSTVGLADEHGVVGGPSAGSYSSPATLPFNAAGSPRLTHSPRCHGGAHPGTHRLRSRSVGLQRGGAVVGRDAGGIVITWFRAGGCPAPLLRRADVGPRRARPACCGTGITARRTGVVQNGSLPSTSGRSCSSVSWCHGPDRQTGTGCTDGRTSRPPGARVGHAQRRTRCLHRRSTHRRRADARRRRLPSFKSCTWCRALRLALTQPAIETLTRLPCWCCASCPGRGDIGAAGRPPARRVARRRCRHLRVRDRVVPGTIGVEGP